MAEQKRDDMLATGTHRAWVGEKPAAAVRAGTPPRDSQRNWLDRTQPHNSRHGAITRSLYSWNNYKSWTDKVRNTFDKDKNGSDKSGK